MPFLYRRDPSFAEGVGNILSEFPLDLSGYSIVILYPDTNISTAEAYRDVFPALQDYLSGNFSTSP